MDRSAHLEVEPLFVFGEVRGQYIGARRGRIRGWHREAGQFVDAVDRRHPQRPPAVLPRSAWRSLGIERDVRPISVLRRVSPTSEVIRRGQPGLARADDGDVDGCGIHIGSKRAGVGDVPGVVSVPRRRLSW